MTAVDEMGSPLAEPVIRPSVGFPARRILLGLLTALIVVFCVSPFLLVFAISFGRKIDGAAWVWDFTLEN